MAKESCEEHACSPLLYYRLKGASVWTSSTPEGLLYKGTESKAERTIYTSFLDNLTPGSSYEFYVKYQFDNRETKLYSFTTKGNSDQITIVAGGDVGTSTNAQATSEQVGSVDADAIVVGGDVSYDNNLGECYEVWDLLL